MPDHPNLPTALAAFQAEMPTVQRAKRADVPTKSGGKFSYTYADLAGVTEAAIPVLTRHGLSFTTAPRQTDTGYELRGVLMHTSGERLRGSLPIRGSTPQEIGSALTYMRRYLFGCLTGVVTEDDDDGALGSKTKASESTPAGAAPTRRMGRQQPTPITDAQSRALHASFNDAGVTERGYRLDYCRNLIGREIGSSNELTSAEASRVLEALRQDKEAPATVEQIDGRHADQDMKVTAR